MAVLLEGISVFVRVARIFELLGSWDDFVSLVPNKTLCCDRELARIGFMSPYDAKEFTDLLEKSGFRYQENHTAIDLVVADQVNGLWSKCEWIEIGKMVLDGDQGKEVAVSRLKGSAESVFAKPIGWSYDQSLTKNYKFVPTAEVERGFISIS